MAKPTNLALWATNTNYPATADPIKVEPSAGVKQAGWAPQQRPPAQWWNWWMNAVYLWMVWLNDFEATAHNWVAMQTFDSAVEFNANATFTDTVDIGAVLTVSAPATFTDTVQFNGVATHAQTVFGVASAGVGADFTGAASSAGVIGRGGSAGAGLVGIGGTGTSAGVTGTGSGAGAGVTGTGGATGVGGAFTAGANANGLTGTGGSVTGHGVVGSAIVAAYFGLYGTGVGGGVKGEATGGSGSSGGYFLGDGAGAGVLCSGGVTGYGLNVSGNATRSPIHVAALLATPVVGIMGDMFVDANGKLNIYNGAAWVIVGTQT